MFLFVLSHKGGSIAFEYIQVTTYNGIIEIQWISESNVQLCIPHLAASIDTLRS
jgi:hypothetical protein